MKKHNRACRAWFNKYEHGIHHRGYADIEASDREAAMTHVHANKLAPEKWTFDRLAEIPKTWKTSGFHTVSQSSYRGP